MANIMSMTKLRNKVSRNGFDLSRKNLFTAKVGEALPVACIECIPGDSFDIDMAWFTRTQPVNTAAYTRMREYYDWYFVPTNLMWNKFNTFVTQMSENNQKATGINGNVKLTTEHPYFTYDQISDYVNTISTRGKENFFGFSRAELTCKLLHYLDYGDFSKFLVGQPSGAVNAKLNPFPLLAYQKIYQDYIRDSQWEKAHAPSCNIDYISGAAGTLNLPISEINTNSENMFDLRYFNWNKDYFMGLLPNSQYGSASIVNAAPIDNGNGVPIYLSSPAQGFSYNMRATGYTENVNYPQIFGIPVQSYADAPSFVYYGNNSSSNSLSDKQVRLYLTEQQVKDFRSNLGLYNTTLRGPGNTSLANSLVSVFSILSLRQAEAKQKWAEITQSQQQDYKSQIEAHFDVKVSDAYSDRCKYIGGVNGNIDIEAVTNQNLTGNNDANIAGRGQGGSRGSINFETKVHGYLMCIYHAVPLLDFAIDGIKRQNLKTSVFDYAIPEFDATGMVSVPLVELTSSYTGATTDTLLGYAPRYIDYKSSYDLVHGAFFNGGLDAWVAPVDTNYIKEYFNNLGAAISSGAFNYHFFKVPSAVLNPIFGLSVDSSVETDQLLINASFDIKAVRNLDRNGLPY